MDSLVFGTLVLLLVLAWLAVLAWRLRSGATEPLPADLHSLEGAKRTVRELRDQAKAEPRRQLEAARSLGGKPR